jgi:Protein of unknown function (DUF3618)
VSEIAKTSTDAPKRTAAQIEADMTQTRERLVGTIAELEDRVKPANVAKRGREKVEAFLRTETGGVRWDHVGMVVGGAVAVVAGIRITSRSVRWLFGEPRRKPTIVYVPTPALPAAPAPAAITAA